MGDKELYRAIPPDRDALDYPGVESVCETYERDKVAEDNAALGAKVREALEKWHEGTGSRLTLMEELRHWFFLLHPKFSGDHALYCAIADALDAETKGAENG